MIRSRVYDRAKRRPIVFLLVYGAFLVVIGITATAQAMMTSSHVSASVLSSVATADRAVVGTFIESYVHGPTFARTPWTRSDTSCSRSDCAQPLTAATSWSPG